MRAERAKRLAREHTLFRAQVAGLSGQLRSAKAREFELEQTVATLKRQLDVMAEEMREAGI
jgi:cell division protein FtsB